MAVNNYKINRLGTILSKKEEEKKSYGSFEDYPIEDRKVVSSLGCTLSDIRIGKKTLKPIPDAQKTINDPFNLDPSPITNEKILTIRRNHCLVSIGKPAVRKWVKQLEHEEFLRSRRQKKIPKVRVPESMLPNRYIRGELPCTVEHGTNKYLSWACPLDNLDYEYYLPLFFDGLQCYDHVVSFIARQGIEDMLFASKGSAKRVISCLPNLVIPLRNALGKYDPHILLGVLKALEQLITSNKGVGEALMPYARQFLAPLSYYMDESRNIGDAIDYGQRNNDDIGEQVRKVLELMETNGGPKALEYIKFAVPLYCATI